MLIDSVLQAVGNTPLLHAHAFSDSYGVSNIYAKLEMFNPYSVKDRAVLSMLNGVQASCIVEATSGNTGIGVCMAGAARGIRVVIVMPENASDERKKIMTLLGAELVLTPSSLGMQGATQKARELVKTISNAVSTSQFDNPKNPAAHAKTAQEIVDDLGGVPDVLVATVGTGGTFSGIAREFKAKSRTFKAYAVEPSKSPLLSGGIAGAHGIPGIGANFVPNNFDRSVCDGVITVSDQAAVDCAKTFAKTQGLLCGISSGAALCACVEIAKNDKNRGKRIVTVLPDSMERYLSMEPV